jgi:hypothetical protein
MLGWIDGLEAESKTSLAAAASVVGEWAAKDPAAASQWMKDHENHPGYDVMVDSMARSVALTDTEGGVAWANSIRDEALRQSALDSVIRKSMRRDAQGAPAQLAALGIDQARIDAAHQRQGGGELSLSVGGDQLLTTARAVSGDAGGGVLAFAPADPVVVETSTMMTDARGTREATIEKIVVDASSLSGGAISVEGAGIEYSGFGSAATGGGTAGSSRGVVKHIIRSFDGGEE